MHKCEIEAPCHASPGTSHKRHSLNLWDSSPVVLLTLKENLCSWWNVLLWIQNKGPFKYYVSMFLAFLVPPTYVRINRTVNQQKMPFFYPTYLLADVILEWSLMKLNSYSQTQYRFFWTEIKFDAATLGWF